MNAKQRRITQERIDSFRAALADPERESRQAAAGIHPLMTQAEADGMRGCIEDLEAQLRAAPI